MTTVYVLFGQEGEYSDRTEWVVGAYINEADANADCDALNATSRRLYDEACELDMSDVEQWWDKREAIVARLKQHDMTTETPSLDRNYFVESVPVYSARRLVAGETNPT